MIRKRRNFNAPFNAKVALEAIEGHRTLGEPVTDKYSTVAGDIGFIWPIFEFSLQFQPLWSFAQITE